MSTPDTTPHPAPKTKKVPFKMKLWAYHIVCFVMGIPIRAKGYRTIGAQNVPKTGAVIFAGNHTHALDPFAAAIGTYRNLYFMAKKELFDNAFAKFWMLNGGTFPVDRQNKRDTSAIRTSLDILSRGEALGLFPQGTRGGNEAMGGVAFLALKSKAPIVPMFLSSEGTWVVHYGQPIEPKGTVESLTQEVMAAIAALDPNLNK